MKRGRKSLGAEKDGKYAVDAMVWGKSPDVVVFANMLKRLFRSHPEWQQSPSPSVEEILAGPPGIETDDWAIISRNEVSRMLNDVGSGSDESLALFFEELARYIRSSRFRSNEISDPARFNLARILQSRSRTKEVSIVAILEELSSCGVKVSERWISDECKALGYKVRKPGTH